MSQSVQKKAAPGVSTWRRGKVGFRARRAVLLAACGMLGRGAGGASWDTVANNGTIDGGGGFWDLFTPNWTGDGSVNAAWVNGDAAVFGGGSGGTVTIA